jgi:hypothetical protein
METNLPGNMAIGVKGDGGKGIGGFLDPANKCRRAYGLYGTTDDPLGAGILADNTAPGALFAGNFQKGIVVYGDSDFVTNLKVQGTATVGTLNVGTLNPVDARETDVNINANLNVAKHITVKGDASLAGTLNVTTDIILAAAASDCAEDFDVAAEHVVEPGTVMVLDDSGSLRPSEQGYDRKVAGIISGAGDFRPGMILGRDEFSRHRVPIALVGKVYCKADAQYEPIEVGDLLTTSPTRGHAMKASDPLRAFGAVIGKALRPLHSGQSLVPVLIALQ